MFSQKKSFFRGKLFYVILAGLFAFGIWLNQAPASQDSPEDISADSNYPSSTKSAINKGNQGGYDILDNIVGKNPIATEGGVENSDTENTPADTVKQGYYLVKEVDGVIKIFYYDEQGKEKLIRDTDIAFSLLSVGDQNLFQKGVIKHSEEDLNELLQDFES